MKWMNERKVGKSKCTEVISFALEGIDKLKH